MFGRLGLNSSLAGAFVLLLGGCASEGAGPVKTGVALAAPDAPAIVTTSQMKIAPLDVLDIKVFGTTAFDGTYQVDPTGEIKVPLIGVVSTTGYTVFELASVLEHRLGDSFLQNPQVSIRISELYGQRVTVDGAIRNPGLYPVRGSMTLIQAIALSGGPTESANPHRVVIFRTIDGKKQAAAFDLLKIRNGSLPDPPIYGNDTIVMDGSDLKKGYDNVLRSLPLIGLFTVLGL